MSATTITVYVPRDSAALAVGADEVADALQAECARRGIALNLVRNGSRGLFWLEPLVEVATPQGRIAYGPVTPDDVPACSTPACCTARAHALCHGLTEQIPYLAKQERLTFARMGITDPLSLADYEAHEGFAGLRARARAGARGDRAAGARLRPARARRRGLPDRHQVEDGAGDAGRAEVRRLQRRRRRLGHLLRPHDDGGRPVHADRRHDDRRHSRSARPAATSTSAPSTRTRSRR